MSRYIDADLLLSTLNENKIPYDSDINYFICHAPTADVRLVVRGEWIPIGEVDKDNNQRVECSHCHAGDLHAVGVEVPYCWRCGARMVSE